MGTDSGIAVPELSAVQYSTVYNLFSLVIASMIFTALYLLLSRGRVAPRYRNALVVSAIVCGIAAYHYIRIFDNFQASYPPGESIAGFPPVVADIMAGLDMYDSVIDMGPLSREFGVTLTSVDDFARQMAKGTPS